MTTRQESQELDMPDEAVVFEEEVFDIFEEEVFEYLVDLRDSGVTNMWGAAPYIVEQFDVSNKEAVHLLMAWIKSFD